VPPLERVYQIAFIVESIEPACERWAAQGGAGPFFLFDPMTWVAADPADPQIAIALGWSGDVFVELIERRGTVPSVFSDTPAGSLHHVARLSSDVDATLAGLAAQGSPTAFRGVFAPDTRMGFADTRAALGCWTEVIEATAAIEGALTMLRQAHDGWDGRDPVRRL